MKVGLLVTRAGPAGLWAPSCDAGAMLAVAQINTGGGVLGREVSLVLADAGQTDDEAIASSRALVEIDGVDAVVGMHPSNVRSAIHKGLSGRVPYIYTPQYEGGERAPYLVTTGGTDDEVLGPAISWLTEHRGAQRFFLIGNDYVWPLRAHEIARKLVQTCGAQVVGQSIVPWGTDYSEVLDAIRLARPDVVVMALLGMEAADFNRAFSEAGLASKMLRLGLAVDETVLYTIGAENTENLYVSLNYFAHMHSAANDRFLEDYHDCFGELAPPVNLSVQSCYEGIHYVANLARTIGRSDGTTLAHGVRRPIGRSLARSTLLKTPMGPQLRVHLAAAEGIEFRTVSSC
jgi:ABC-type branched-subunit amino acid transport system substrate-binding protein